MKVLADTHVLIWAVQARARMPRAIAALLNDAEVWASVVSVWEMRIKCDSGRLALIAPPQEIARAFQGGDERILPVTLDHAAVCLPDPPATKDPFDRLLLAQCEAEGMKLVTADSALRTHRLAAAW